MGKTDDFASWHRKIERMGAEALPKVVAATVNVVAGAAHSRSRGNLRRDFTLRNTWTERSLRYWKANPKERIGRINAVTGSASPYLPIQEKGGTVRAKKASIPIATKAARGGTKTRVVLKRYRLGSMGSLTRRKGGRFFVARIGRKKGVWTRERKRLLLIQDLSFRSYRVKATGWHSEAVRRFGTASMFQTAFMREARRYLDAES